MVLILMARDYESFFIYFLAICTSFMTFSSSFCDWVFYFGGSHFLSSLHILDVSLLYEEWLLKHRFPSVACLLSVGFAVQNFFFNLI